MAFLATLDAASDKRAEQWERKRMLLDAELEERRREKERKHEERMQTMMMGFMQQVMLTVGPNCMQPGKFYVQHSPPPPTLPTTGLVDFPFPLPGPPFLPVTQPNSQPPTEE